MAFTYGVKNFEGYDVEFTSPTQLTKEQVVEEIANQIVARQRQQRELEQTAESSRGLFRTAADIGLGLGSGVAGLGATAGELTSLVGLPSLGRPTTEFFRDIQEGARELQSEKIQAQEELFRQRMAEVEGEGLTAEAGAALGYLVQNPAYLTQLGVEQIPQLLPIAKAGQGARALAQAAFKESTEKALNRAGVAGAATAAGAMQGSNVGMQTYDRVYEQMIAQGMSEEEAAAEALAEGQKDALQAGAVTLATTYAIPGAKALERVLPGVTKAEKVVKPKKLARTRGAAVATGGEATQEAIEEGFGQYISNISAIAAGEATEPLAGVGQAAGTGAAIGGVFGAPAGFIQGGRQAREDAIKSTVQQVEAESALADIPPTQRMARIEEELAGFDENPRYQRMKPDIRESVRTRYQTTLDRLRAEQAQAAKAKEAEAAKPKAREAAAPFTAPRPEEWFATQSPEQRLASIRAERGLVDTDAQYQVLNPKERKQIKDSLARAEKQAVAAINRRTREDKAKARESAFATPAAAREDLFGVVPTATRLAGEAPISITRLETPQQFVNEYARAERLGETDRLAEIDQQASAQLGANRWADMKAIEVPRVQETVQQMRGSRPRMGETFGGPQREVPLIAPAPLTETKLQDLGLPKGPVKRYQALRDRLTNLDLTQPEERRIAIEEVQKVDTDAQSGVLKGKWAPKFVQNMQAELARTEDAALQIGLEREFAAQPERDRQAAVGEEVEMATMRGLEAEAQAERDVRAAVTEGMEAGVDARQAARERAQAARAAQEAEAARAVDRAARVEAQAQLVRDQATGRLPIEQNLEAWKDLGRMRLEQNQEDFRLREQGLDQMAADEAAEFELDMQYVDDRITDADPMTKADASAYVQQYREAQAVNDPELIEAVDTEARAVLGSTWGSLKGGMKSRQRAQERALQREAAGEITPTQPDLFAQAERAPEVAPEAAPEAAPETVDKKPRPQTIEIDGVQRSTANSKGQPIHSTEKGLRNFWRWFGDSDVVDAQGRPLVIYHGTLYDFTEFKFSDGRTMPNYLNELGYFFDTGTEYPADILESEETIGYREGANIMPVYVKAKLMRLDSLEDLYTVVPKKYTEKASNVWGDEALSPKEKRDKNNQLLAEGFRKYITDSGYTGVLTNSDGTPWVVALKSDQIKSAIGNTGAFAPGAADIVDGQTVSASLPADIEAVFTDALYQLTAESIADLVEVAVAGGYISESQADLYSKQTTRSPEARARVVEAIANRVTDIEYFRANPDRATALADSITATKERITQTTRDAEAEIKDISFSRSTFAKKHRSTKGALERAGKNLLKKLRGTIDVEIVQSVNDLPDIYNIPDNVRGFYANGKVYVIADATSVLNLEETLAHEAVGHAGMEQLLGKPAFKNLVNQVIRLKDSNKRMQAVLANIKNEYTNEQGEYNLKPEQEAREIIAHIAEAKTELLTDSGIRRVWNNIVAQFKRALAKIGILDPADALLDQLIYEAALYAQGGRHALRSGRSFHRSTHMASHTMERAWDKGYRGFDLSEAGRYLRDVAAGRQQVPDPTTRDPRTATTDDSYLDEVVFSRKRAPEAPVNDGMEGLIAETLIPERQQQNTARKLYESVRGSRRMLDMFRVNFIDSAATVEDKIMRAYNNALRDEITGTINPMVAYVQALRSEGLAAAVMRAGTLKLDPTTGLLTAKRVQGQASLDDVFKKLDELGEKIGKQNAKQRAHSAMITQRELEIDAKNRRLEAEADALDNAGKKKAARAKREKIIDLYPGESAEYYAERMDRNRERMQLFQMYPEIQEIFDMFTQYKNNLLDSMVETGYLSKEKAQDFKEALAYIPFNRVMEAETETGAVNSGYEINTTGLTRVGTFKKLNGSTREINDVFDNMASLSVWMTQAAVRNYAAKELIRGMREVDGIDQEYKHINEVPEAARKDRLVTYRDKGVLKYATVKDPLDAWAWRGTESINLPGLRLAAAGADWLRKGITLSPDFILSQLQQDTFRIYAFGGLKNPARGGARVAKEWWRIRRNLAQGEFGAQDLNQYGIVGMYDVGPERGLEDVATIADRRELSRLGSIIQFGERNAEASDLAARKAVFDQTMAETNGDALLAFWRASEIINFNRRGKNKWASLARQLIPFQNAYFQGLNVLGKTLAGRGLSQMEKKQALILFGWTATKLALISGMLAAAMADDEDYINQPSYIRTRYFAIPTGDDTPPLKIALPADLAFLVKALPEAAVMTMMRDDLDSKKTMTELRDAFATAVLGPNMVPQLVKPSLEALVNYNFFTGGPIVGLGEQQLATEEQYRDSTSQLAKLFGKVGVSPLVMDHLMKGYFGTLGSNVLTITDVLAEETFGIQKTERELADFPLARSFFGRTQATGFKTDYYQLRDDVRKAVTTYNKLMERGDIEGALEFREQEAKLFEVRGRVNAINRMITDSNRRIRAIRSDDELTSQEKRQRVDEEMAYQAEYAREISELRKYAYD